MKPRGRGTVAEFFRIALGASVLLIWLSSVAQAHSLSPAVLGVTEVEPGVFAIQWTPSFDAYGNKESLKPRFPAHCRQGMLLDCGQPGLTTLSFERGQGERSTILVFVEWQGGASERFVVPSDRSSIELEGGPRSRTEVFLDYVTLGVDHILGGIDHLAFVLGLVLLTGFSRALLWVVTGFTIAHATTLVLSTLGVVTLPSRPVEAVIALSVLWVAREAYVRRAPGFDITRAPNARRQWMAASSFGLLHGFGFAGALAELGLPAQHVPLALASFNLGVELGQLLFIGGLWVCAHARRHVLPEWPRLPQAAAGVMGGAAGYWVLERWFAL